MQYYLKYSWKSVSCGILSVHLKKGQLASLIPSLHSQLFGMQYYLKYSWKSVSCGILSVHLKKGQLASLIPSLHSQLFGMQYYLKYSWKSVSCGILSVHLKKGQLASLIPSLRSQLFLSHAVLPVKKKSWERVCYPVQQYCYVYTDLKKLCSVTGGVSALASVHLLMGVSGSIARSFAAVGREEGRLGF